LIITRTPFRVSLFGGGSDYPAWYRRHGGKVIGFAVDKFCYISVRVLPPFFAHKHRIVYSVMENVREIADIQHPAVRAVFSELAVSDGIELHHDADLPARSGLGSSSAFTVGLLNALYGLHGRSVTPRDLAIEATRIEQDVIREHVGSQDQVWAAYGGLNKVIFHTDGGFTVTPVTIGAGRRRALEQYCHLYYTGRSRIASDIAADKIANLDSRAADIREMMAMVDEAEAILHGEGRNIDELGSLLHESWLLKRGLSARISNGEIDDVYDAARQAGALGGKLLGAGGGGFLLLFVPPQHHAAVRQRLGNLIHVPCGVAPEGSRIVMQERDGAVAQG